MFLNFLKPRDHAELSLVALYSAAACITGVAVTKMAFDRLPPDVIAMTTTEMTIAKLAIRALDEKSAEKALSSKNFETSDLFTEAANSYLCLPSKQPEEQPDPDAIKDCAYGVLRMQAETSASLLQKVYWAEVALRR